MQNFSDLPQKAPEYDLTALLEAGCHFGHHKSKWNPKMDEWIYSEKDGVHIFDLAKTASQLQIAYNLVNHLASQGKTMVVVGTKRQASSVIAKLAEDYKFPYINSRWLGGLLTNWSQVSRSLKKMLEIEKGLDDGAYKGYTKYEQVQLEKELSRLRRFFDGIRMLKARPDFLFIIDPKREKIALKEAKAEGVKVIALVDSNTDPDGIDVVVPANDDAFKSIQHIATEVVKSYQEAKDSK